MNQESVAYNATREEITEKKSADRDEKLDNLKVK
jgi:hypothetical protein